MSKNHRTVKICFERSIRLLRFTVFFGMRSFQKERIFMPARAVFDGLAFRRGHEFVFFGQLDRFSTTFTDSTKKSLRPAAFLSGG